MNRIFLREDNIKYEDDNKCRDKLKIGVISTTYGAGNSLVAMAIAQSISEKSSVAFVEICNSDKVLVFDMVGMDKRFAGRTFTDAFENSNPVYKTVLNMDSNINWILRKPENIRRGTYKPVPDLKLCSIVNNAKEDVIVCDIDYSMIDSFVIEEMDFLIVVIDPSPKKLLMGYKNLGKLKFMKSKGKRVMMVVNKFGNGVNLPELNYFLGMREYMKIPVLDENEFLKMEYNCKLPYEYLPLKDMLYKNIKEIEKKIFASL